MRDANYYERKYEQFEGIKNRMPDYFEQPEHISKHLLDVNQYQSNAVNHDSARANLNPNELRQARADGSLILELEEAENTCNWDLNYLKAKVFGVLGVLNVTSRSKNGWASVLSKTDKHINVQTMESFAEDTDAQFSEATQQGLGDKISSKIPFLKRTRM